MYDLPKGLRQFANALNISQVTVPRKNKDPLSPIVSGGTLNYKKYILKNAKLFNIWYVIKEV